MIWRKLSFRTQSGRWSRFVETTLTVVKPAAASPAAYSDTCVRPSRLASPTVRLPQCYPRGERLPELLFSPADAEAERKAAMRAARKTPVQPSQVDRRKAKPKRKPGARYMRLAYAYAIRRACIQGDVPHWHPHQLRHNAATLLRREIGIEAARTILGHASADVTEIYAEPDLAEARDAASRLG